MATAQRSSGKVAKRPKSASKPRQTPTLALKHQARAANAPVTQIRLDWLESGRPEFVETPIDKSTSKAVADNAAWWNYALLLRDRWRDTLSVAQQTKALALWETVFGDKQVVCSIGPDPEFMEVTVNSTSQRDLKDLRTVPWEFVVNSVYRANRPYENRRNHRIPVIRRWPAVPVGSAAAHTGRAPALEPDAAQWKVMVVLSAPGFINTIFTFASERHILGRQFVKGWKDVGDEESVRCNPDTDHFKTVWTPKFSELQSAIDSFAPDLIHFAGCDTHQAFAAAEEALPVEKSALSESERQTRLCQLRQVDGEGYELEEPPAELDGYALLHDDSPVMHGDETRIDCVSAEQLAMLFKRHQPALVCWNIYHSGNRTAALAVGVGGVGAAIGFQDYIDNAIAEEFFDEFYRGLVASGGRVAVAQVRGLRALWRLKSGTDGAGIICWTASSRLGEFAGTLAKDAVVPTPKLAPGKRSAVAGVPDVGSNLFFDIELPEGLNYAQLHHKQYPFTRFRLYVKKSFTFNNLCIEVKLNGEDRELVYRGQFNVSAPFVDFREAIEFPLTAPLARSCRESVVTTLYVKIKHKGKVLHSATYRTRLLPADQWRFSEGSAHTLASFIFPRDPQIECLLLKAQKVVRVLRDDVHAGFEGYQSDTDEDIDLQVQAIWATLLHEYNIGYINPPPAYSANSDSQRLRTPTMVLKGGWGTCVDLALLLAAAMELIDVYPVVFVLKTHAFAGYWRNEAAREDFLRIGGVGGGSRADWSVNPRRPKHGMFLTESLREIRRYTAAGKLVALEATLMTAGGSFREAIDAGLANLEDEAEFDYMIDLASARTAHITPLPLQFN